MRAPKRNTVILATLALMATIAMAAVSYDRLKDTVVVGQGNATTKKIQFDIGNGSANPAIQSTSAGVLQFANDGVNFTTFGTGSGGGAGVNLLANDGFELGVANWTNSGGTFTTTSTAANVGFDLAAGAFTASAGSQTLTSDQKTVPAGMYGQVCSARIWYKGGSANLTLKVIDGSSTLLASQVLSAQTNYVQTPDLRFTCPTSGTVALQIASTGSSAIAYFDKAFLGQAPRTQNEGSSTNLISNGNAEDQLNPTSWTVYDDGASASAVDATGGSPANITAAAIDTTTAQVIDGSRSWKFVKAAANAQGQGWSYPFTFPTKSQLNNSLVSLKFDYYMDGTGAAIGSDLVRVYVYDVTNSLLITPSFVTCGGGSTPSLSSVTSTCHAELAFLATTGSSYRLALHVATTSTTALTVWADNFFVGDYKTPVGVSVGPWTSFTPTIAGLGAGATTTNAALYRRVGDSIEVWGYFISNSSSNGSTGVTATIPSGYTINTSALPSAGIGNVEEVGTQHGIGLVTAGQVTPDAAVLTKTSTSVQFRKPSNASTLWQGSDFGTNSGTLNYHYTVPINELSGGTAFGENKVEYVYNTSGLTTAGASDTTSYGYGPAGAAIGSIASTTTTGNSVTKMRVQFTTPIQATDVVMLENDGGSSGARWFNMASSDSLTTETFEGTANYGAGIAPVDSTHVDAVFGNAGRISSSTYGAAGTAWSGISTWRWRVKKFSGGTPVGFGAANTTTPGLVSYEDSGTFTASFTGPRSTTEVFTYSRVGKTVTLEWPTNNTTCTSATVFAAAAASVPSGLRPAQNLNFPLIVVDSGANQTSPGYIEIDTDGSMQIPKTLTTGNFTGSGSCGWLRSAISYTIN